MSIYMPRRIVVKELEMQQKRRLHGLKTGTYVKYPDAEKGPYILLARKADELKRLEATQIASKLVDNTHKELQK